MNATDCGLLFDLDGVVIDSESTYTRFWDDIDKIYPTGIPNFAIYIKGTTLESILTHFPDEKVKADIVRRIKAFQDVMTYHLFPGAERLLAEIKSRGIACALVTSSDDRKMHGLFSQIPKLKDYFDVIIDSAKVTRSKPDPQGYLLAAEELGRKPENCFVFEDSLQGLKAGRAAGATVIGLTTTYPYDKVAPLADKVINTLADITVDEILALK